MKVICTNWAMTGAPPCSIGYMLLYQCVFFSKRYGYVTKSIHPFEMYDIPFPGSFSKFCKETEIQKVGTINRSVMKKICDFWRTKNHHFPIEIILSNHRIPSKKPWNVQKKHVPNRMMILNDPIQSKLWLLWFLYRLVI